MTKRYLTKSEIQQMLNIIEKINKLAPLVVDSMLNDYGILLPTIKIKEKYISNLISTFDFYYSPNNPTIFPDGGGVLIDHWMLDGFHTLGKLECMLKNGTYDDYYDDLYSRMPDYSDDLFIYKE